MKKTYQQPGLTQLDLGTTSPLCASLKVSEGETNKALSTGDDNPWDASCWAPADEAEQQPQK